MPQANRVIVFDNCALLSLLLPDEQGSVYAAHLFEAMSDARCIAPSLIRFELANALSSAVKRKRIIDADVNGILLEFGALEIEIIDTVQAPWTLYSIAQTYSLSAYDAAYLDLAIQYKAVLATNDQKLKAAAVQANIVVI